jgi:hypothetical protein
MENSIYQEKFLRISKNVAKRRVKKMKRFYTHFMFFAAGNIVVAAINYKTTPDYLWYYWLTLGWGMAILIHGFSVFSLKDWEAQKVKELMAQEH